jgi:hypothetical protein
LAALRLRSRSTRPGISRARRMMSCDRRSSAAVSVPCSDSWICFCTLPAGPPGMLIETTMPGMLARRLRLGVTKSMPPRASRGIFAHAPRWVAAPAQKKVRQTEVAGLVLSYAFPPPKAGCRIGISRITQEVGFRWDRGGPTRKPKGVLIRGAKV